MAPLLSTRGGVGTYVRELLKALSVQDAGAEFFAYVPRQFFSCSVAEGMMELSRVTWVTVNRWTHALRSCRDHLDVYHGTNFKLQTRGRRGSVITIHDLWLDRHPEFSKKLFGQRLSFYRTRQRVWRADLVIAVSRFTAQEIQEHYELPDEYVRVVHHGVSSQFYPDHDRESYGELAARLGMPAEPYIVFAGGADPRKNHETLFRAYARHEALRKACRLVAVGNAEHRLGSLHVTAGTLGISDRVVITGPVSLADLRLLYSHATVFAFPSRYEGFGFPVLEAMACGAPVVTSNRTSLPEIAGDAAVIVDPEAEDQLGDALGRLVHDSVSQDSLRQKGFLRAKQFSWETAARQTLAVYKEVCVS